MKKTFADCPVKLLFGLKMNRLLSVRSTRVLFSTRPQQKHRIACPNGPKFLMKQPTTSRLATDVCSRKEWVDRIQFEIEIPEEFSNDNLLELPPGNKADVSVSGHLSIANSTKATRVRVETTDD